MKLKWSGKRKTGNLPGLRNTKLEEIEKMAQDIQDSFGELVELMRSLQKVGILKIRFVHDG